MNLFFHSDKHLPSAYHILSLGVALEILRGRRYNPVVQQQLVEECEGKKDARNVYCFKWVSVGVLWEPDARGPSTARDRHEEATQRG